MASPASVAEVDVRTTRAADPVALHQLDRLRPVQRVQVRRQRSPYAVIRIIHCFRLRWKTGKLPRSLRPSGVTSSLASTVPRPGHQLTGAWLT